MGFPGIGRPSDLTGPGAWDQIGPELDDPPGEAPNDPPYGRSNRDAVPINQRSPRHWSGHTLLVDGTQVTRALPSQKGRKAFLVLVPPTLPPALGGGATPAGVFIDEQSSVLSASGGPMGFFLPVGASISVNTEGGVFLVSGTPGTDTVVCVLPTWD